MSIRIKQTYQKQQMILFNLKLKEITKIHLQLVIFIGPGSVGLYSFEIWRAKRVLIDIQKLYNIQYNVRIATSLTCNLLLQPFRHQFKVYKCSSVPLSI